MFILCFYVILILKYLCYPDIEDVSITTAGDLNKNCDDAYVFRKNNIWEVFYLSGTTMCLYLSDVSMYTQQKLC